MFKRDGEYIKCEECGKYYTPFYFGDKPLNRGVMQDCPGCGHLNSFCPATLPVMSISQRRRLEIQGQWLMTSHEEYLSDAQKTIDEEYDGDIIKAMKDNFKKMERADSELSKAFKNFLKNKDDK